MDMEFVGYSCIEYGDGNFIVYIEQEEVIKGWKSLWASPKKKKKPLGVYSTFVDARMAIKKHAQTFNTNVPVGCSQFDLLGNWEPEKEHFF